MCKLKKDYGRYSRAQERMRKVKRSREEIKVQIVLREEIRCIFCKKIKGEN